jgi:hypothetical protein
MILKAVSEGKFLPTTTRGLIVLLHKEGEGVKLTNWQPIILI